VADLRVEKPGPEFIRLVMEWLNGGNPVPPKKAITLEDLIAQYGAEAVLEANGGMPPSTQEEIEQVAKRLGIGQSA
jgi:organic radical activating enzyme